MTQITERHLESGDTITLGSEIADSYTDVGRSGQLHIIAAWEGEATEHVVIRTHVESGNEIEDVEDGEILSVESGSGMANPEVWMLIDKQQYDS